MLFFKDIELLKLPLFCNALSKNLSDNNTNNAPIEKPIAGNTHAMYPSSPDKSIAGASNDQNEDAIITPALNPNIVFKTFLFISLKKHTTNEPNAVTPHVNVVAMRA